MAWRGGGGGLRRRGSGAASRRLGAIDAKARGQEGNMAVWCRGRHVSRRPAGTASPAQPLAINAARVYRTRTSLGCVLYFPIESGKYCICFGRRSRSSTTSVPFSVPATIFQKLEREQWVKNSQSILQPACLSLRDATPLGNAGTVVALAPSHPIWQVGHLLRLLLGAPLVRTGHRSHDARTGRNGKAPPS